MENKKINKEDISKKFRDEEGVTGCSSSRIGSMATAAPAILLHSLNDI